MMSRGRRFRAYLHYLRKPILGFLPLLGLLVVLLVAGSISFHKFYRQEDLTYLRALYITYCLIFMEHLVKFPEHWLLEVFSVVLPPLGLVVILDGIVRFSYHVLRRDLESTEFRPTSCPSSLRSAW